MALKHKNRKGFSIIRWVFLSTTTTVLLLYVDILFRNKRVQPFTDQFKNLIRQHNGEYTQAQIRYGVAIVALLTITKATVTTTLVVVIATTTTTTFIVTTTTIFLLLLLLNYFCF